MASSKAALMDAFTCIWVASVNQMVLIPTPLCLVKCPPGSSEHLMGVSSICTEEIHLPVARKNECIFLCTEPSPWLRGGQRDVGLNRNWLADRRSYVGCAILMSHWAGTTESE